MPQSTRGCQQPRGRLIAIAVVACMALVSGQAFADHSAEASAHAQIVAPPEEIVAALRRDGRVTVSVMFDTGSSVGATTRRDGFESTLPAAVRVVTRYEAVPALVLEVASEADLASVVANPGLTSVVLPPSPAAFVTMQNGTIQDQDVDGPMSAELNTARPAIGASQLHERNILGQGQTIAVLDSGADAAHPDLAASVVFERCHVAVSSQLCPDGSVLQQGPGAADDDVGHGTHVAGIITGDGIVAPLGVAPAAAIELYKVGGAFGLELADVLASLDFILANRPSVGVINMSIASTTLYQGECGRQVWPEFHDVVEALAARGTLVLASTGNGGQTGRSSFPACLGPVVAVAASADTPVPLRESNISSATDVTAPGFSLLTTARGGGTASPSGTSFATPIVSACAALFMQEATGGPAEVEARLRSGPLRSVRGPFSIPWISCAPRCLGRTVTVNLSIGELPTAGDDVILGTSGHDIINAGPGDDIICAYDGNDFVVAGRGDDLVAGGRGDDRISAGPGRDIVNGQVGNDSIDGDDGPDILYGSFGNDTIRGGIGWDTIQGNSGADEIDGGPGNDNLNGGSGNDAITGEAGHDLINLGPGDDQVQGGEGNDHIAGQRGDDTIAGQSGSDRLSGQAGNDLLDGGDGWDRLDGGAGFDRCLGGPGIDLGFECEEVEAIP